jgi:hypothetical protein
MAKNAIIIHPKRGNFPVLFDALRIKGVSTKWSNEITIYIHTHDDSTTKFLNEWIHTSDRLFYCTDFKSTMVYREPTSIHMCYGVWPYNINCSYDSTDSIACECKLKADTAKSYGIDDVYNFDIILEYIRHFAKRVNGTVDILGSPMFRVVAGSSVADFELSGHIVCGNNKSHIADPEWENKVARWLGVAPQRLSR